LRIKGTDSLPKDRDYLFELEILEIGVNKGLTVLIIDANTKLIEVRNKID